MNLVSATFFSLMFFLASPGFAKKFQAPALSGPVIDEAGLLSPEDKAHLESLLYSYNDQKIAQVQIYIASSLQEIPLEQASIEITDQWKLGDKTKDNGILFLIAPNEKKMRLEVGQGLEGTLPDVYAKRITSDVVVPYFKAGRMSDGVVKGTEALLTVLNGGELAEPTHRRPGKKGDVPFWVFILVWIVIFIIARRGGGGGSGMLGGFLLGNVLGSGRGGGWGGGGGGSSWGGGGGGFSGGGSSSSW